MRLHGVNSSMKRYKKAFKRVIKSGCRFPKWHSTFHYPQFIREYGTPALTYTGWWEKAHRYLCKMPFLRIGRRRQRMEELLLLRIALTEIVRRKERALELLDPKLAEREAAAALDRAAGITNKRRRGSDQAKATDDTYDIQPERLTGRDKNGYINHGKQ